MSTKSGRGYFWEWLPQPTGGTTPSDQLCEAATLGCPPAGCRKLMALAIQEVSADETNFWRISQSDVNNLYP